MIAYVREGCNGCQQFVRYLASSPALLVRVDLRWIDRDERALLDMLELGVQAMPVFVVPQPQGGRRVFQGSQATIELVRHL